MRYSGNIVTGIAVTLCLIIVYSLALPLYLLPASGQHHGALPPAANIGDRNISLDFKTLPNPLKTNQDAEMKIGFLDEKAKKNVNHVTFRMDISKDGRSLLSEFFHSHEGPVNLLFKGNINSASTPRYTVGATSDVLTNAWIADPGSPIIVRGGEIFSRPDTYKAVIEVTTMDNDKTDLPQPIKYEFDILVLE
ncbi:MAG: hypothetical protein M3297_15880 [Thermoproteota archaeon]|jgi:hypothetical protein|nr:hypothetical protein [Thermoproteota archaeon]